MSYLMVVPVIDRPVTLGFVEGLKVPHEHVMIVDNGESEILPEWDGPRRWFPTNAGVAGSWNVGARVVLEEERDWLVIASSAVRWGSPGGVDFIDGLEELDGPNVAATSGLGWHLLAINRSTLDLVGLFDENFYPACFEDTDYLYRMHLCGLPSPRENGIHWDYVACDAEYGEQAHGIKKFGSEVQMNWLGYLYQRKWGGKQGNEQYETPWGVPNYPIWKWPAR